MAVITTGTTPNDIARFTRIGGSANAASVTLSAADGVVRLHHGQTIGFVWPATNTGTGVTVSIGGVSYSVRGRDGGLPPVGSLIGGVHHEFRVMPGNLLRMADGSAELRSLRADVDGLAAGGGDMTETERAKLAGIEDGAQVNDVSSVAGRTGAVVLTKADVGLALVDNTSDENKPVSLAQGEAIESAKVRANHTGTQDSSSVVGLPGSAAYPFASRAEAMAATIPTGQDTIAWYDHGVMLMGARDPSGTAITTNGGAVAWRPADEITALHWGVVPGDRGAALANAARINAAADWCRANGITRLIGVRGTVFFGDVIDLSGVIYEGHGIAQWEGGAAYYGARKLPAASQLVPVDGAWPTRIRIYGISSAKACGGARVFSAPRANINETDWQMTSLMNADATTGVATAKALKVGVVVRGVGGGLRNTRIMPDGGGDDGLDAYNSASHGALIGTMDIGILQIGGQTSTYEEVQSVGHWLISGAYVAAVDEDFDYSDYSAPYDTIFRRCLLEGMRGLAIRCQDRWKIIGYTSTTVDLPWADDHPFTLDDGVNRIRLVEVGAGTAGGAIYAYTGVAKVNVGGEDRVRLSGLTGFTPGIYGAVVNGVAGGANSHIITRDTSFGSLTLPNGWPVNHATNGAGITNGAIGGIEVSGWRCAEEDIQGRVQHDGTVVLFKHDGREGTYDILAEASTRRDSSTGMRIITSPQTPNNAHATHVSGEARWIEWRYLTQNEYSATGIDFAPFLPVVRPAAFASADDGWFETFWGIRPLQVATSSTPAGQVNRVGIPGPVGVGDGFEGFAGGAPDAMIHARASDGAEIKAEATAESADAAYVLECHGMAARMRLDDSASALLIEIDPGKTGTFYPIFTGGIEAYITSITVTGTGGSAEVRHARKAEITIPDQQVATIQLSAPDFTVQGGVTSNNATGGRGQFWGRAGASPFASAANAVNFAVSTTDVTGTTGPSGTATLSIQNGLMKLENNTGAQRTYELSFY